VNNVIYVDFGKKNKLSEMPDNLSTYLTSLYALGLDEDDVLDTIDAINDTSVYFAADDEIKAFADGWLQQFL
jgi:hypothetical protein